MNKKIKIIDLIDKIYHKNNIPKKIKVGENIYSYDYDMGYFRKSDDTYNLKVYLTEDLGLDVYEDLVREVEILEDNTEEIEELDTLNAYKLMESPYMAKLLKEQRYDEFMEHLKQSEVEIANTIIKTKDKINELVKAVNGIRKDLNK